MTTVLHVIAPAPVGGAESVVLGLCEALTAQGESCALAAIVDEGEAHPFVVDARRRGIAVHPVASGHRRYAAQVRALASVVTAVDASVVHSHGYHADVIAYLATRGRPVARVSTLHGFTGTSLRDRAYDLIVRFVHRRAARVVAVSKPIVERLAGRGIAHERIVLLPNAWRRPPVQLSRTEARVALGLAEDGPCIGWVGRFSHEKGPDVMLEALAQLGTDAPRLSMVGDGPMRDDLRSRATALGIESGVTWHGLVAHASRYLPAFDLLVLSSRTEGAPMILLEAMGQDVPVVAAAVGGIPEMFSATELALVAPDRPAALAAAIRDALANPAATRARGHAARALVERTYGVARWVSGHRATYDDARRAR